MKIYHHKSAITRRVARVRGALFGTAARPRLSIDRSSAHMFAQLIDDAAHKTLLGLSTTSIKEGTKTQKSAALGTMIAQQALKLKIGSAIFDRGRFRYHGRLKALAEAARAAGLKI